MRAMNYMPKTAYCDSFARQSNSKNRIIKLCKSEIKEKNKEKTSPFLLARAPLHSVARVHMQWMADMTCVCSTNLGMCVCVVRARDKTLELIKYKNNNLPYGGGCTAWKCHIFHVQNTLFRKNKLTSPLLYPRWLQWIWHIKRTRKEDDNEASDRYLH